MSRLKTRPRRVQCRALVGIAFLLALELLVNGTGCQQLNLTNGFPSPWGKKDDDIVVPNRLTAMWSDTILNQPDKPGVRGFGGRLMFYKQGSEKSVRVSGKLVVYAYDD